jgi:hypothetical protein
MSAWLRSEPVCSRIWPRPVLLLTFERHKSKSVQYLSIR